MAHANARTNLFARRLLVQRVAAGWPPAQVAEQLGITRATVHKWLRRHAEGGDAALADRCSRSRRMPNRTMPQVEKMVLVARRRRQRGAVMLAAELGLNASTVGRILRRHDVPHLAAIDPITGERIRTSRRSANRYERPRPGGMIHVDVKKLGRIPAGGGWRLHGRDAAVSVINRHKKTKIGYDYVPTAIDDHTRLVYSEVLPDEKDHTCAEFLHRAPIPIPHISRELSNRTPDQPVSRVNPGERSSGIPGLRHAPSEPIPKCDGLQHRSFCRRVEIISKGCGPQKLGAVGGGGCWVRTNVG